jgi:hypothetical protein
MNEQQKKSSSEITTLSFDEHRRKLIIGNSLGQLKVFEILSGVKTRELTSHNIDEKEIANIGYGGEDGTIVTIGWD